MLIQYVAMWDALAKLNPLQLVSLRGGTAISLAVALICIFGLAHFEIPYFSLLPSWVRTTFLILGFLIFAMGVGRLLDDGWKPRAKARAKRRAREFRKVSLGYLDTLSSNEREYLGTMVELGQQTLVTNAYDGTANSLVSKGLLTMAKQGGLAQMPFTVPNFVWNELLRRKDEFTH